MVDRDKLRKVEAVLTDKAATAGEKAAARKIRAQWYRRRAEEERAKIQSGGFMYLLGRAFRRSQDSPAAGAEPVAYAFGRALRRMFSRR